jgi:hypothetical protein
MVAVQRWCWRDLGRLVMAGIVLRGRVEPMAAALGLLRRVIETGQGGGLIIPGEAGIGKTIPAAYRSR